MQPDGRSVSRIGISAVLGFILIGAAAPSNPPDPSRALAERALALLVRGDADALAAVHHYPESYTPDERRKDVADVATGLRFLFARFGKLEETHPTREPVTFYEIGGGGGTDAYWASLSPIAKIKDGPPELREISYGLPTSSPTARTMILNLTADLMTRMGVPLSADVRRSIAEHMQPTIAPPADIE